MPVAEQVGTMLAGERPLGAAVESLIGRRLTSELHNMATRVPRRHRVIRYEPDRMGTERSSGGALPDRPVGVLASGPPSAQASHATAGPGAASELTASRLRVVQYRSQPSADAESRSHTQSQ